MNSQQFEKLSRKQASKAARYITDRAPAMVVRKTLRFIDGNFRAQGWQGKKFERWKKNSRGSTILVKDGALRRSFNYSQPEPGTVKFYSNVKYAGVHNQGFKDDVRVKSHQRNKYGKSKIFSIHERTKSGRRRSQTVTNKIGSSKVKGHTKKMNIPKRQFAPYEGSESPVLNKSITRELEKDLLKIFNQKR